MSGDKASSQILVDTDILIDIGRNVAEALATLREYEQQDIILAVSIVTKMELVVGCRNKREQEDMKQFISRFTLFNINDSISTRADELLLKYRLSHGLLIADALIAATAIDLGMPLISKNQRDYRFIEELNLVAYP